jgi:AcrR family transcriptional regulator
MKTVVTGLRERKKNETRTALRAAAVALVGERGLAAVTVEDIAEQAGVSARTFFNYFPSKEDAVIGWDPDAVVELAGRLADRPAAEPPPVALGAALLETLDEVDDTDRDALLTRLRVTRGDPHLIARYVARWAETERHLVAGVCRRRGSDPATDRYAALVVAVTLAAARAAMLAWCDTDGRVPLRTELAAHLDTLHAGLAEPERSIP